MAHPGQAALDAFINSHAQPETSAVPGTGPKQLMLPKLWEHSEAVIAEQRAEIRRLRAALLSLLNDPPPTLDEPDTDGEVIMKLRRLIRAAL